MKNETLKFILDSIFSKLLKRDQITRYSSLKGILNDEEQTYSLCYHATLSGTNNYCVSFVFIIHLPWREKKFCGFSSSRKELLYLTRNFLIDNTQHVYTSLVYQIKQWRKGEQNERLFYKRFLESLPKKYPALIKHVAKSSQEMDQHFGIDFSVWFEIEEEGRLKLKQLDFNIKSSDSFLEKHHLKYPTVGTFIFTKDDLKNKQALEEKFLGFMLSSLHLHTTLYW